MPSFNLDRVCHSSLSKRVSKGLRSLRSRFITSDTYGTLLALVSIWEKMTETLWLSTSLRFLPALGEWVKKKGQKYCQIRRKEWLESEWTFDDHLVQPPCYSQWHLPLSQADLSPAWPWILPRMGHPQLLWENVNVVWETNRSCGIPLTAGQIWDNAFFLLSLQCQLSFH